MSQTIEGYGAVFYDVNEPIGTEFRLEPDVYERIDPQAFTESLRYHDVFGTMNHDANYILGRTPKTMSVDVDRRGLKYRIKLGQSPLAQHVQEAVERGDLTGSSFSFFVEKQKFHEEMRAGKPVIIRTIQAVRLLETGPVAQPAYGGTTAGVA